MTTAPPPTPPPVDQQASEQPPPPPGPRPFPPLRRSGTDRMLGGVCGGLAEYSRIDPLLWRVGFVALAFFGPGVIVYLLLWVLMTPAPGMPDDQLSAAGRLAGRLHERLSGARATGARD